MRIVGPFGKLGTTLGRDVTPRLDGFRGLAGRELGDGRGEGRRLLGVEVVTGKESDGGAAGACDIYGVGNRGKVVA